MPDPASHIESTKVPSSYRPIPIITDLTTGGKGDFRIWETKENVKFFLKPPKTPAILK